MKPTFGLFNESYAPIIDGVATVTKYYAEGLHKRGEEVCVVTPHKKGGNYGAYPYKVLDYASIPIPGRKPYVAGLPWIDWSFQSQLGKIPFKLVHANSPFVSSSLCTKVAKKLGIPMVGSFHSKYRDDFEKQIPIKAIVDKTMDNMIKFYERCDEVWVPEESVIEVIREYGYKGPVEVMRNGTDLIGDYPDSFFADARAQFGVKECELMLLYIGQHVWQKNLKLAIEALELLKDLPYRMFFIGGGYAAEEMRQMVQEKGLADKITFVGPVRDRALVTKYYAAADLFLFPSLYDTASLVMREAASLRTPSVMIKGATTASVATDNYDSFLTENTPEAYAARIRDLFAHPEQIKKVGLQASTSLVRSWDSVVDEVLDRYNALIARKSK